MQSLVADEEPAPAVHGAAGRPDELAAVEAVTAEVAVVSAIQVAHGDPNAPGGFFLAAADNVEAVIFTRNSIHRVVETLAFHDRHAQGAVIDQEIGPLCSCHKAPRFKVLPEAGQKAGSQIGFKSRVNPGSSESPEIDSGASSISTGTSGR